MKTCLFIMRSLASRNLLMLVGVKEVVEPVAGEEEKRVN